MIIILTLVGLNCHINLDFYRIFFEYPAYSESHPAAGKSSGRRSLYKCKACLTLAKDYAMLCKVNFIFGDVMVNKLEELRNQKGWTQQELSDRVSVSRQTIISLERGRYNPSILLAFKLARQFGVKIEDIFIYSEEEDIDE